jgi:peptidoglycan/LPS O-acetylase OafA/YrhL
MLELPKNSFDLQRFFAAALVLYNHQHALLGFTEPESFNGPSLGGLGGSIFFFLSGFLTWSSWTRDPDLRRLFVRQCLRVIRAQWLAVLDLKSRLCDSNYPTR